jgi:NhaP-type Na+/H+ or K+/H+ antiporter
LTRYIIILGILAQWLAWRLNIPAILPLILVGLLVGPISAEFFTEDGSKWIEPLWNGEKGLFPGDLLYQFVSLSISIILFEGGLTLKRDEIRNVGPSITKLITIAPIVTFLGAGVAAHFLFGLRWDISFLFSSLIIVTGPTVISPILRNIPLKKDVSTVLKWEGILIDPIGALIAVLVFEFISVEGDMGFGKTAFIEFGKIVLFGTTFGFTFAHGLAFAINKKLIPHYLLNVVSLSVVLLVYVESDLFAHESGLLAVVVMGIVLGNRKLDNIKDILYFKESLSVLLISILFILLSANINIEDMMLLFNWQTLVLFFIVVLIIRPVGVFLSTYKSSLKFNEKTFISWVGPRGIVAAGIASLFGSKLMAKGVPGSEYITPLVFMIVLGTVLLNATTARPMAKLIGVFLDKSEGILIIGASKISRLIAHYLVKNGRHVVVVDSNQSNTQKAHDEGLESINADIYSGILETHLELNDVGYMLVMTGNHEINVSALERFSDEFGENGSFRLVSSAEAKGEVKRTKDGLLSPRNDYNSLCKVVDAHPHIHEEPIKSADHFKQLMVELGKAEESVPLFLRDNTGFLHILSSDKKDLDNLTKGSILVYMGKKLG